MFHFQRRTLWIIMYITIPLILILNNLGPESDTTQIAEEVEQVQTWSLDELNIQQSHGINWLDLNSATSIEMSVVLNTIPTTSLAVDNSSAFSSQLQGGKLVLHMKNPTNQAALEASLSFLEQWLPNSIEAIVVSGPYSEAWALLISQRLAKPQGEGIDISIGASRGLAQLISPPMKSPDQLAFLMAVSILKQRLSGYDVQMSWDHRRAESVVSFNSTLSAEVFSPVSQEEFAPVINAFVESANNRARTQSQLHRYLQTAMVYNVPFSFFVEQPKRLAQVTIEDVNRMMEFALEQIETPQ